MQIWRNITAAATLVIGLVGATSAYAEEVYVTKFRDAVSHYNTAVTIVERNAPLNSSDSCEAIHNAIVEYTLAVDGFLDVQSYGSQMTSEERTTVHKAFQRANDERRQLFVLSRRYC